jgi:hypothetical protein
MSAYKYVVFPRGQQPSAAELAQLQSVAAALAGRYAWGTCRDEPRLAVAFEAATFDHVRGIDPAFERLIARWQSHGCELAEHLKFIKDPAALTPKSDPGGRGSRRAEQYTPEPEAPARASLPSDLQPTAYGLQPLHSSLAHSLLAVDRTLQRYNSLARLAAAMPYLLMAVAALLTIALGLYARDRLMNSGREPRQQTIERLATEPAEEPAQR